MPDDAVVAPPDLPPRVRAFLERAVELYGTQDVERMLGVLTEDCAFHDHRPLGAGTVVGAEAITEWTTSLFALLPGWTLAVTVLAHDGDVYLARDTYSGDDEHGGTAMIEWYVVDRLRGDQLQREDIYADEESARARFEAMLASSVPEA